jgi:hypothetical protein
MLALVLVACGDLADDVGADEPCNGSTDYCDRPYNEVAVACTHNAMSNVEDWGNLVLPTPNQANGIGKQLDDGVRCLMLDTYEYQGSIRLCHGECFVANTPFVPMLNDLADWLEANPGEVVTFILESYVDEAAIQQSLMDGGVWDYVYHHDQAPGSPWPTLGEMVDSDQRLVVFTDDGNANGQWHLDWRTYGWETPYNDPQFTCEDGRGDPTAYDDQVFILNHYTLCGLGGCESNAQTNNAYDFFLQRALDCWSEDPQYNPNAQIPTFLNVDHYHVPTDGGPTGAPDVIDVAAELNSMWVP